MIPRLCFLKTALGSKCYEFRSRSALTIALKAALPKFLDVVIAIWSYRPNNTERLSLESLSSNPVSSAFAINAGSEPKVLAIALAIALFAKKRFAMNRVTSRVIHPSR